jgi:hypothetical protein
MKQGTPIRETQGRVDVLFGRLIEAGVKRVQNPVARAILEELHEEAKPSIAADLHKALGPKTKHGKHIKRAANFGEKVYRRLNGGGE